MTLPPKVKEYWTLYEPKLRPFIDKIKNNKILVLPLIIVVLVIFTVFLSISQSEKQKRAQDTISVSPQETIAPLPTGPVNISRAGTLKAVKYGSSVQYFVVLKNGDALKLEIPGSINVLPFIDKSVLVSGILNEDKSTFKIDNITAYSPDGEEDNKTPVPYPNTSPTPTPSPLPLSSPTGE
jgi:hypothetical protein